MSRMSDMTEAYSLLTQDQIDEIEECLPRLTPLRKSSKPGVRKLSIGQSSPLHRW